MENKDALADLPLTLSVSAAARINKVVAESGNPQLFVRLEVLGGGCSGFQYKFGLDKTIDETEDVLITRDGARLVVDTTSLGLIRGSEVDFGESLMEAGFRVRNPNAASSCGCGSSFSVNKA